MVATIGRAEIWRSLGTGDHAVAVKLYRRARANLDDWFDQQRRRRDACQRLNGEAPRLVVGWFHEQERLAAHADFNLFGDVLHNALGEAEQELHDLIQGGEGEVVAAAVDRVLLGNGWQARPYIVGEIVTRRIRVADAPDEHRAALAELVRRA